MVIKLSIEISELLEQVHYNKSLNLTLKWVRMQCAPQIYDNVYDISTQDNNEHLASIPTFFKWVCS